MSKMTVEALAEELFKMWDSQPTDYSIDRATDDLWELLHRLGIDGGPAGADRDLVRDAYMLSMKKIAEKGFRAFAIMKALDAKPTGKPQ